MIPQFRELTNFERATFAAGSETTGSFHGLMVPFGHVFEEKLQISVSSNKTTGNHPATCPGRVPIPV
jgi:hypothetical protein